MQQVAPEALARYTELQTQRTAVLAEIKELKKKNKGLPGAYFATLCTQLFNDNPRLESFSWNQYTPYWNDGDTCYFNANTNYPDINGTNREDEDEEETDHGAAEAPLPLTKTEQKALEKAVVEFLKPFDDDTLLEWFGDHVEINVKRGSDGADVTVSEYEHE